MEMLEASPYEGENEQETEPVISTIFDLIDWGGKPQDYFLNRSEEGAEQAFRIVSGEIQNFYLSVKSADEEVIKNLEERNALLKQDYENSNSAYEGLHQRNYELSRENNDLKLQLEDQKSRVSAAALQLDEANQEIARLKSQIEDLQTEKALGAKQAIKVVDTRTLREQYEEAKRIEAEQARKELEEREAAKPAIYNVQNADPSGKELTAILAETGETITFPYLQKGRYRVVSEADAATFRAAYLERQAEIERNHANHPQPGDMEEVEPTAPRVEEDVPADRVAETTPSMAGTFITEERIASIEERLAAAEQTLRQITVHH